MDVKRDEEAEALERSQTTRALVEVHDACTRALAGPGLDAYQRGEVSTALAHVERALRSGQWRSA